MRHLWWGRLAAGTIGLIVTSTVTALSHASGRRARDAAQAVVPHREARRHHPVPAPLSLPRAGILPTGPAMIALVDTLAIRGCGDLGRTLRAARSAARRAGVDLVLLASQGDSGAVADWAKRERLLGASLAIRPAGAAMSGSLPIAPALLLVGAGPRNHTLSLQARSIDGGHAHEVAAILDSLLHMPGAQRSATLGHSPRRIRS
jgi:hypothetical protein